MSAGRVALITGASGGIGADLAERMTEAGYIVVATARNTEDLAALRVAERLRLDVTSEESAVAAVGTAVARFGRIDVLVNCAGLSTQGAVEELSDAALRQMFEVNVLGTARMLRLVAPAMRAAGSGTIVNVSSLAGLLAMPVNGGYAATKFAVEALSDAARQELAPFGVRVIVVEPGSIATRFTDEMIARSAETLDDEASPYRTLYECNAALTREIRSSDAQPSAVSDVVLKALASRRPKARYAAAIPLLARLLASLAPGVRDRIWTRALSQARSAAS